MPVTFSRLVLVCALTFVATAAPPHKVYAGTTQKNLATNLQDKQQDERQDKERDNDQPLPAAAIKNPLLWHQPSAIASLDLFYGEGGKGRQPEPPYTFVEEDLHGTNAKMDVRDSNDKKWRVKEGEEARPEVVASRLLWAMGFYVNEDYLLQQATVSGIEMKRGSKELKRGNLTDVRFSRKPSGQKKIGIWEWGTNPFTGTREFNGLRVMMAVMNNWDLKDVNNSVYADSKTGSQLFLVNDVGATFGANGVSWTRARSKGNIGSFQDSKFIQRLTDTEVDFSTPKRPTGILIATGGATAKSFKMRSKLDWIGKEIPRQDARWMGSLLSQLTHKQLVDAFRAGNFPSEAVDSYVQIVESRIAELEKL